MIILIEKDNTCDCHARIPVPDGYHVIILEGEE